MTRSDRPERTWTPTWDERGVSDVLAFVFVFSIIITSVGLVTAVGFKVLEDIQQGEQAVNAERGMQSLAENLGEVQRGHAPGRTGELKLSNGAVYVRQSSEMTVTVSGSSCSGEPVCINGHTFGMGTLYYDMQDRKTNVTYESGAVFREDRGGSPVMIQNPRFYCSDSRKVAIISIITLRSEEGVRAGEGTVQIVGRENESKLYFANDSVNAVQVSVGNSRFDEAWDAYFTSEGDWVSAGSDWVCDFGSFGTTGKVFVRRTIIDVKFVT